MPAFRALIDKKPSALMWAIALSGLVLVVGATRIIDYDIWWHLRTGEIIWLWHQIPRYDIFSYTAPGAPWVNHEWLFQVVAWLLYSKIGIPGLVFMKLAVTICVAYLSFRTFEVLTGSRGAALWGAFLLIYTISDRITERPHIFSLLFIAYFAFRLHQYASSEVVIPAGVSLPPNAGIGGGNPVEATITGSPITASGMTILGRGPAPECRNRGMTTFGLWDLPVLMLLWINFHGGGPFGVQMVFVFALGESLQRFAAVIFNRDFVPVPLEASRLRHLWLIAFACFAAAVVNPYGIDVYLFSMGHLKMKAILAYTQEWLPFLSAPFDGILPQIVSRAILALTMVSYIVNCRRARLSHLMLTILTCALILNGKRFAPDLVLINLPILFFNFKALSKYFKLTPGLGYLHSWGNIAAVAMLSFAAVGHGLPMGLGGEKIADMGFGIDPQSEHRDLVNFLYKNNIRGRVFNEMGIGGYLIFTRWPHDLVFVDGRTPVYGDDFYKVFVDALHASPNFEALHRQYGFDYIVFKADQAWNMRNFHRYLWDSGEWRLVYANCGQGLVYLHDEPKFKTLIKKLALKEHPIIEMMKAEEKKSASPRPKSLPPSAGIGGRIPKLGSDQ